jgi:HEAT repeat protein
VKGWIKSRRSIPDSKEESFRQEVIAALARIGDASVVDIFIEMLSERALFKGHLLQSTKKAVLDALAQMGTDIALQALRDAAAHKDNFVSATAADILKRMESKTT